MFFFFFFALYPQDVVIVGEALQLLVLCLQLRTQLMGKTYFWQKTALPNTLYCWQKFKQPTLKLSFFLLGVFYYLPNVNDFIVEVLIGSINSQVYFII